MQQVRCMQHQCSEAAKPLTIKHYSQHVPLTYSNNLQSYLIKNKGFSLNKKNKFSQIHSTLAS
jgi:hypothetical protein